LAFASVSNLPMTWPRPPPPAMPAGSTAPLRGQTTSLLLKRRVPCPAGCRNGSHLGTAENPTPNGQPQRGDKDAPTGRMARSLTQREDWTRDSGGCLTALWQADNPFRPPGRSRHGQEHHGARRCAATGLWGDAIARRVGSVWPLSRESPACAHNAARSDPKVQLRSPARRLQRG
jgi:hypothetical protein